MPLPYPHGASAGQIAHNSFYDTGVTPGSTGGKFIGWGEEGTSGNANRAHWALSENIDYVYQRIAADKAIPKGQAIASGHGGIDKYQLSGEIFVGDSSYPTLESEGLLLLFAVMDENYNELTDGSDNEVLVYLVRDSTETTNVYKDASVFVTDPWVYFEANGSPYTIPDAQEVRLLYAEKGNMENLPVDAFTRFKLNSAAEAAAGVVLQDGTRAMTGDLNLDNWDIVNVNTIDGAPWEDLQLMGNNGSLYLRSDMKVVFKDQHVAWPGIELSQAGETDIYDTAYGEHDSILGSLNAKTHITEGMCSARTLAHGYENTVSIPGSGGVINWGATGVVAEGQFFLASAGSLNMASPMQPSGWYYVVTNGFIVYLRSAGSLQTGDVPLWYVNWDGANIVESRKLARPYNGRTDALEITVGGRGSDFSSSQLQEALNYAAHVGSLSGSADVPGSTIIKINTGANWGTTLQVRSDVIIRGEGVDRTVLRSNCGTNNDAINANGNTVIMEDLTIQQDSDEMVGWVGMIRNFGSMSVFRNLKLKAGTSFNKGFSIGFLVDGAGYATNCMFDTIRAEGITTGIIRTNESGLNNGRMHNSHIVNVDATFDGADYGFWITGRYNVVENCEIVGSGGNLNEHAVAIGAGGAVRDTNTDMSGATGVGIHVYCVHDPSNPIDLQVTVDNCWFYSGKKQVAWSQNNSSHNALINIRNTHFRACEHGVYINPSAIGAESILMVSGCTFRDTTVTSIWNNKVGRLKVHGCNFHNQFGSCIEIDAGGLHADSCFFEGFGTGGTHTAAIDVAGLCHATWVTNCQFGTGAATGGYYISSASPMTIMGNHINGPGGSNTNRGINLVGGSDNSYVGQNIIASVKQGVWLSGDDFFGFIIGVGHRVEGNRFWGIPQNGIGVVVYGSEYNTIIGNEFSGSVGRGVQVMHNTVLGDAKGNNIIGNMFFFVEGNGTTDYMVIRVKEDSGSSRMTSIVGNKFYYCGSVADTGGKSQAQIWSDAGDTFIANNYIAWVVGHSLDGSRGIMLYGSGAICNNYIMHDFSTAVAYPYAMTGIEVNSTGVAVNGNFIDFKNSGAGGATIVYCIYVSTDEVSLVGNTCRDWETTATEWFIYAPNLADGLLVANMGHDGKIQIDGDSGCPMVGNNAWYGIQRTGSAASLRPESKAYNDGTHSREVSVDLNWGYTSSAET